MKKKLLIYPQPKKKININTHANVCSFFLSKYLSRHFDIIPSSDLADSEEWVKYISSEYYGTKERRRAQVAKVLSHLDENKSDVDYCLTTVQRGFAKLNDADIRFIKKINSDVKLCSIHDHFGPNKYNEDYLFVARKIPNQAALDAIVNDSKNKSIRPTYMGWCADHKIFDPSSKKYDSINIVMDHAALQDFRADITDVYLKSIFKISEIFPDRKIKLVRLNKGFEFFNFDLKEWTHDLSFRWWESEYDKRNGIANGLGCNIFQIAECLNSSHIFCVTHVESCGLTGIEALMAGCKLYIPSGEDKFVKWGSQGLGVDSLGPYENVDIGIFNGPFIKKDLVDDYMDYRIFDCSEESILNTFLSDIDNLVSKSDRLKLIENNSWKKAADRIRGALENA